jgi:hypothetical protein
LRRTDLTIVMLEAAVEIAQGLNRALDAVTIAKEFCLA